MIQRRHNRGGLVLALIIGLHTLASAQIQESFEGFIAGIRANAVKGDAFCQRDQGNFNLEPGVKLQDGDFIRTAADSYAELVLQPGNYLRIGPDSECQILSEAHDKMRLKLTRGTISLEIMGHENDGLTLFYSAKLTYELIRVITPNTEVFITEPGIFRITLLSGARTELINRKGESVISGQRIKSKRKAIVSRQDVFVGEWDSKSEDGFDLWGRERADKSIKANKALKKDAPWVSKRKEGQETIVEFPFEEEDKRTRAVVSAKPGAVNYYEAGVQVSRPNKEWEQLNYDWQFEAGDKLRTDRDSFAELSLLPDIYLRLNSETEIHLEQLSNELILVKLVRGAAILDVARYEVKEVLPIRLAGPTTSVDIVGEGLYRVDIGPNRDQIEIREGKAILNQTPIGDCRVISGETVFKCDETERKTDKFNAWSQYRGEGKFFFFRRRIPTSSFLLGLRRRRFRSTGFWFQNPGKTDYTFVPFTSPRFRSPYGGNYSTVLAPPNGRMRPVVIDRPLRGAQGPPAAMP